MTDATLPRSWRHHFQVTLSIGLPLIGSYMAQILTNTTDVIMLGWYGVEPLAASVLATQIWFVIFIFGSGFAIAVMPMVAAAFGAHHGEDAERIARRAVRMGLWISLVYAFLFLPILWNFKWLLGVLKQDAEISALAQDYMRIAMWTLIPALVTNVLRSFLSALEHTKIVLIATLTATFVNAFLNYALIFGNLGAPELGLQGAAIATIITTSVSCLIIAFYATRRSDLRHYRIFQRFWRPDPQAIREVFMLGWPISVTLISEIGMFSASSVMVGWIGTVELATHGIIHQISSIAFMIPLGLSNVSTIRVGQLHGRGAKEDLRRSVIAIVSIALVVSVAMMVLFLSIPETLTRLFLDPEIPQVKEVLAMAATLLAIAGAFQICDSLQVIALGTLRGLKDTRAPMIYAAFAYWVIGMPSSYLLGVALGWGVTGIWLGLAFGLTAAATLLSVRFIRWFIAFTPVVQPQEAAE